MEQQVFEKFIEAAKKRRKAFNMLKQSAVICEDFEFASILRDIERETFPETEEVKAEKVVDKVLKGILAMLEVNTTEEMAWLINEAVKAYNEKGGEFSMNDAVVIKLRKEALYLNS